MVSYPMSFFFVERNYNVRKSEVYDEINQYEIYIFITKDAETAIGLFEALGFERRHTKEGFGHDVSAVRMKDSNGL